MKLFAKDWRLPSLLIALIAVCWLVLGQQAEAAKRIQRNVQKQVIVEKQIVEQVRVKEVQRIRVRKHFVAPQRIVQKNVVREFVAAPVNYAYVQPVAYVQPQLIVQERLLLNKVSGYSLPTNTPANISYAVPGQVEFYSVPTVAPIIQPLRRALISDCY